MKIFTSSWFTPLPPSYLRIGVSRSVPRGYPAGYRRLRVLEPGPWFNSVTPEEFHRRYMAQLHGLDAQAIVDRIGEMAVGYEAAALVCYERSGWCHRAQVSLWFEQRLGLCVPEHGQCCCGAWHPLRYRG
jgi:Domain of unknown function DUF488